MASKAPPVPKDQRSDKIRGAASPASRDQEVSRDPAGGNKDMNLEEQARYGDINQNTHNQGYQQDR